MRTIKFRAWQKAHKKMHYKVNLYSMTGNEMTRAQLDNKSLMDTIGFTCEVMQFTGLHDKNGKEIYEGDIGRIETQSGRVENFVVEWGIHRRTMQSGWEVDIPGFCFRIDDFHSFPIVNNYQNEHDLDIIEIIGNIYENPELLNPQPSQP